MANQFQGGELKMVQPAPTLTPLAQQIKRALNDFATRLLKGSMKCQHCGHRGEDVVKRLQYIGGQGYVQVRECADRVDCWERWETKEGQK